MRALERVTLRETHYSTAPCAAPRFQEAKAAYQRVLELEPDNAQARETLKTVDAQARAQEVEAEIQGMQSLI